MSTALAEKDLKRLQEFGFSAQQAEGILTVTRAETQEVATKAEAKMVTREYLELKFKDIDIKFKNMKIYFIVQGVWITLASLGLLGWYINHLNNNTRAYVEARFSAQDQRFNDFKESVNMRFDKIESDLNDIKNFIFSAKIGNTHDRKVR